MQVYGKIRTMKMKTFETENNQDFCFIFVLNNIQDQLISIGMTIKNSLLKSHLGIFSRCKCNTKQS